MKSFSKVSMEELIDKVEENKYLLALKLMLQSVRIAAVRGQSLPIGNFYTNLIESAKRELLLYTEEQLTDKQKV
jgi:ABC-type long-subunit fatty acid transport system fused permease/ATPase subunit